MAEYSPELEAYLAEEEYSPELEAYLKKDEPSFLQSVGQRYEDYWAQTQAGVRQLPGYEALTDWITGAETKRPSGFNQVLDAVKAPGNILMGVMGLLDPVGTVGAEAGKRGWEAVGEPGGEWGRTAAELLGGVAGGIGTAKLASKIPGVRTAVRPGLQMIPETKPALATEITPFPASPGRVVEDGATQLSLLPPTKSPAAPAIYDTVFDEIVSPATRQEASELRGFLRQKNLSPDERQWAQIQLARLEGKVQLKPRVVETAPASPERLLTGDVPGQPSLLEIKTPDAPAMIQRGDVKIVGHGETGGTRVAPGQLDGVGFQMQLFEELENGKTVIPDWLSNPKVPIEKALETVEDPGLGTKLYNAYMNNFQNPVIKSIGLLVTAPSTAIRNFMFQLSAQGAEIPKQALQEVLYTGSLEGAWTRATAQLTGLIDSPRYRQELFDIMQRTSPEVRENLGRRGMIADYTELPAADWYDKTVEPVQKFFNKGNELQEKTFWYASMMASLKADLAPLGLQLGKNIKAGDVPQALIDRAVDHAYRMTFSAPMGKQFEQAYKAALKIPLVGIVLNEAIPFARFNYSNALWQLMDASPAGFMRAALNTANPEEAAKIMAQSMLGTKMIEQFARMKEDTSLGVWEVNIPGIGKVDLRRWHPISAYALIGEAINRPPGSKNSRISLEDIESLMTGGTRLDDTMLGLLTRVKDLSLEGIYQGATDSLAAIVSRWTTPMKWGQDIYQLTGLRPDAQAIDRDVTTGKYGILDRAVANIPGLRDTLPERIDPTLGPGEKPGPRDSLEYLQRLTGLEAVRSNVVKDEMNRLKFTGPQGQDFMEQIYESLESKGINIRTPESLHSSVAAGDFARKMYGSERDKDLNRAMNTLMRDVGHPYLQRLVESEGYQKLPIELRRFIFNQYQSEMKNVIRKVSQAGGGPELVVEQFVKDMSPVMRGFMDFLSVKD